jgi:hypothetical protein
MSKFAAILPAFNEEVSVGSVVLRARRYAGRVIVVDDGSSDTTAEVAELRREPRLYGTWWIGRTVDGIGVDKNDHNDNESLLHILQPHLSVQKLSEGCT